LDRLSIARLGAVATRGGSVARKTSNWIAAACACVVALLAPAAQAQLLPPRLSVTLEPQAHGDTATTVLTQVAREGRADGTEAPEERWILNAMWSITNTSLFDVTLVETSLRVGDSEGRREGLEIDIPAGQTKRVLAAEKQDRVTKLPPAHVFQGDILEGDTPPTTATSTLTFESSDGLVQYGDFVLSSTLKVHRHETPSGAYQFPVKATDLSPGLYWAAGRKNQDNTAHHYPGTQEDPLPAAQWYAYDLVVRRWDAEKREWTDLTEDPQDPLRNEDHLAFGMPVYAMDSGTILHCRDSNADQEPGDVLGPAESNRLWIRHGAGEYALYTHLKQDSIPAELCPVGENLPTVQAGQLIGHVGNTGGTDAPHLHVHISRNEPTDIDDNGLIGLPFMFDYFKTAQFGTGEGHSTPVPERDLQFSAVPAQEPRSIPGSALVVPGTPFVFAGFGAPINNDLVNVARAGQTIPVKYRLTAPDGTPISDPTSFTSLKSRSGGGLCGIGVGLDEIEVSAVGDSGLQYLGDGNWQFNWKTAKDFAGQCRTMTLTLEDGSTHTATFQFR
jgi:hypothetical protein